MEYSSVSDKRARDFKVIRIILILIGYFPYEVYKDESFEGLSIDLLAEVIRETRKEKEAC